MRRFCCFLLCCWILVTPVSALEIQAPTVPEEGQEFMPQDTTDLGLSFLELFQKIISHLTPNLKQASRGGFGVVCTVLMVSILKSVSGPVKMAAQIGGTLTVASILMSTADSMVELGTETILQISDYGKLLLPVMTAALAAQGGITASGALYAGTALFDSILTQLLSRILVPGIWLYLAVSIAGNATGEDMLKKITHMMKGAMVFLLKILLTVFTTYLGLTGVVTGATDAAALKATKVAISSVVPVVGSILSDASEAVLVSASMLRSAAGIYGIFAVLAIFLGPFIKIGAHYLLMKLTCAVCSVFGEKSMTELIGDFSTAMGLLLAMTGAGCVMTLISTVCFLREVG